MASASVTPPPTEDGPAERSVSVLCPMCSTKVTPTDMGGMDGTACLRCEPRCGMGLSPSRAKVKARRNTPPAFNKPKLRKSGDSASSSGSTTGSSFRRFIGRLTGSSPSPSTTSPPVPEDADMAATPAGSMESEAIDERTTITTTTTTTGPTKKGSVEACGPADLFFNMNFDSAVATPKATSHTEPPAFLSAEDRGTFKALKDELAALKADRTRLSGMALSESIPQELMARDVRHNKDQQDMVTMKLDLLLTRSELALAKQKMKTSWQRCNDQQAALSMAHGKIKELEHQVEDLKVAKAVSSGENRAAGLPPVASKGLKSPQMSHRKLKVNTDQTIASDTWTAPRSPNAPMPAVRIPSSRRPHQFGSTDSSGEPDQFTTVQTPAGSTRVYFPPSTPSALDKTQTPSARMTSGGSWATALPKPRGPTTPRRDIPTRDSSKPSGSATPAPRLGAAGRMALGTPAFLTPR